jgi:hypothetical protein
MLQNILPVTPTLGHATRVINVEPRPLCTEWGILLPMQMSVLYDPYRDHSVSVLVRTVTSAL